MANRGGGPRDKTSISSVGSEFNTVSTPPLQKNLNILNVLKCVNFHTPTVLYLTLKLSINSAFQLARGKVQLTVSYILSHVTPSLPPAPLTLQKRHEKFKINKPFSRCLLFFYAYVNCPPDLIFEFKFFVFCTC